MNLIAYVSDENYLALAGVHAEFRNRKDGSIAVVSSSACGAFYADLPDGVGSLSGSAYSSPSLIVVHSNMATTYDVSTGAFVKQADLPPYQWYAPVLTGDGSGVLMANSNLVDELVSASDGTVLHTFTQDGRMILSADGGFVLFESQGDGNAGNAPVEVVRLAHPDQTTFAGTITDQWGSAGRGAIGLDGTLYATGLPHDASTPVLYVHRDVTLDPGVLAAQAPTSIQLDHTLPGGHAPGSKSPDLTDALAGLDLRIVERCPPRPGAHVRQQSPDTLGRRR